MNFIKSKALLHKINALHDSASSFDGNISPMERDLLLHYLREMYKLVLDQQDVGASQNSSTKTNNTEPTPIKNPRASSTQSTQQTTNRQMSQPVSVAPVSTEPEIQVKTQQNTNDFTPPPAPVIREDLLELFESSTEDPTTNRFRNAPITDLHKALGINDKILIQNLLFGGDQALFRSTLTKLNQLSSFTDAKDYLLKSAASDCEWDNIKRRDKAIDFIQLIKRRYQ